jgi:hypothetical protein
MVRNQRKTAKALASTLAAITSTKGRKKWRWLSQEYIHTFQNVLL